MNFFFKAFLWIFVKNIRVLKLDREQDEASTVVNLRWLYQTEKNCRKLALGITSFRFAHPDKYFLESKKDKKCSRGNIILLYSFIFSVSIILKSFSDWDWLWIFCYALRRVGEGIWPCGTDAQVVKLWHLVPRCRPTAIIRTAAWRHHSHLAPENANQK